MTMTTIRCAGCGELISITADGFTTECGGEGEGICDALVNGDRDAEDSHCLALD